MLFSMKQVIFVFPAHAGVIALTAGAVTTGRGYKGLEAGPGRLIACGLLLCFRLLGLKEVGALFLHMGQLLVQAFQLAVFDD